MYLLVCLCGTQSGPPPPPSGVRHRPVKAVKYQPLPASEDGMYVCSQISSSLSLSCSYNLTDLFSFVLKYKCAGVIVTHCYLVYNYYLTLITVVASCLFGISTVVLLHNVW